MNILKNFRKPYLALFLSSLMIFVSCNHDDILFRNSSNKNNLTLELYVSRHIEISNELLNLIDKEKNINYEILINETNEISKNEFVNLLQNANIKNHQRISELFFQLKNLSEEFVNENVSIRNMDIDEFEILFVTELDNQTSDNFARFGDCEDDYETAENRCERNWVISMGLAFVGGVLTGGAAWLATAGATGLFVVCLEEAAADYEDCLDQ